MIKDAFYFPHDCNARRDPALVRLRHKYGWAGVGMYWAVIESLREQTDLQLSDDDETMAYLSDELHIKADETETFITDLVALRLIIRDGNMLYSDSLKRRMAEVVSKSRKMKQIAHMRWAMRDAHADGDAHAHAGDMQQTNQQTNEQKKKGSNEKARPQSVDDVIAYMMERGFDQRTATTEGNKFVDHFESNGWKIGGKTPMVDWHASVRTWMGKAKEFNPGVGAGAPPMKRHIDVESKTDFAGFQSFLNQRCAMQGKFTIMQMGDKYRFTGEGIPGFWNQYKKGQRT